MPLVFIPIASRLPAGLLVYWITTNMWTIGQTAIVGKRLVRPQQAAAGSGGRLDDLFKPLRSRHQAEPPLSGRRLRSSGDSTTNVPAGSGQSRSKAGSRAAGHKGRRASAAPPAAPRHKKKRPGRRR